MRINDRDPEGNTDPYHPSPGIVYGAVLLVALSESPALVGPFVPGTVINKTRIAQ